MICRLVSVTFKEVAILLELFAAFRVVKVRDVAIKMK